MTERKKPAQWRRVHSDIVYTAAVNHLIKGRAEAIVLHHIADRIRGSKEVCYPTHAQLVADTGLPKATLIRAIDSLVASGLLGRHKGTGGRHSVYWLPLPDAIAATLTAEASALYSKHLAAMKAHLVAEGYVSSEVQAESHVWDHDSLTDGTISVSTGETHIEDETWKEKPANRNLAAGADLGMEGKKEPSMPVADFKLQLLWGDLWPKAPEVIEAPSPEANDGWVSSRIVSLSFKVLGFVPQSLRTASEQAAWAAISEHLKSMDLASLESRYRAGTLTTAEIANTLASAGIIPPAMDAGVEIAQAS